MGQRVANQTLYFTADRKRLVKESDADAAFLFVREGAAIDEDALRAYEQAGGTVPGNLTGEEVQAYDAVADHARKHGGESDREAARNRERMLAGVEPNGGQDVDGPPAEGERGDPPVKAQEQDVEQTKAVSRAPANKAR